MPPRDRVCPAVVLVEGEAIVRAHLMLVSERDLPQRRARSDSGHRLLRGYERPIELVLDGEAMPLTNGAELARVLLRAPQPVPVLFVSTARWIAMHRPAPHRALRRVAAVPFDPARILAFLASLRQRARAA
jgi:hypothetical protein